MMRHVALTLLLTLLAALAPAPARAQDSCNLVTTLERLHTAENVVAGLTNTTRYPELIVAMQYSLNLLRQTDLGALLSIPSDGQRSGDLDEFLTTAQTTVDLMKIGQIDAVRALLNSGMALRNRQTVTLLVYNDPCMAGKPWPESLRAIFDPAEPLPANAPAAPQDVSEAAPPEAAGSATGAVSQVDVAVESDTPAQGGSDGTSGPSSSSDGDADRQDQLYPDLLTLTNLWISLAGLTVITVVSRYWYVLTRRRKRREKRFSAAYDTQYRLNGDVFPCKLVDISGNGTMLRHAGDKDFSPAVMMELDIQIFDAWHKGRALWCNKNYTGVKFHEHIPRSTVLSVHKA